MPEVVPSHHEDSQYESLDPSQLHCKVAGSLITHHQNFMWKHIEFVAPQVTIVGPNGSGKTSLLNHLEQALSGVDRVDASGLTLMLLIDIEQSLTSESGASSDLDLDCLAITTNVWNFRLTPGDGAWQPYKSFRDLEHLQRNLKYDWELALATLIENLRESDTQRAIAFEANVERLLELAASQTKFALVSVGSSEQPRWKLLSIIPNIEYVAHRIDDDGRAFIDSPIWPSKKSISALDPIFGQNEISHICANNQMWLTLDMGVIDNPITEMGFVIINPDSQSLDESLIKTTFALSTLLDLSQIHGSASPEERQWWYRTLTWPSEKNLRSDEGLLPLSLQQRPNLFDSSDGQIAISSDVYEILRDHSARITQKFKSVLPTAPEITIKIAPPEDWLTNGIFRWVAVVNNRESHPSNLSESQQRWLKLILNLEYSHRTSKKTFILLDEPERGLQRSIESLSEGFLNETIENADTYIFMATHSPIYMRNTQLVLVDIEHKQDYEVLLGSLYEKSEAIGLGLPEIFETYRLILIVEGDHDKAILEGFATKSWLESNRILIIVAQGVRSWSSYFSSEIVRRSTSCKVAFLVDALDPVKLKHELDILRRKTKLKSSHLDQEVVASMKRLNVGDPKSDNFRALQKTIEKALYWRGGDDVDFFSTGDPDALYWLDLRDDYGITDRTWEDLYKEATKARDLDRTKGRSPLPGKGIYLKKVLTKHITINGQNAMSVESLNERAAFARIHDRVPPRISALLDTLSKATNI